MISSCSRALVEGLTMGASSEYRREAYSEVAAAIIALIVSITLLAFAGQWLWNNVMCELFTFAKPSRSIWLLVGLKFFILLMAP
jgi:hypothetical protein